MIAIITFASFATASLLLTATLAAALFSSTAVATARLLIIRTTATSFAGARAVALILGARLEFLIVADDEDRFAFVGGLFHFQGLGRG